MARKERLTGRNKHSYFINELREEDLFTDPFEQFRQWFDEAAASGEVTPETMYLATAGKDGIPSARIVLMKSFDAEGFIFFTNYTSKKGRDIAENPFVSLTFYWNELNRQVRVTGRASKISGKESDAYFRTRSHESQAGAILSPQSSVIPGREVLDSSWSGMISSGEKKFKRPRYWGGFKVRPLDFEFWQGREHRLHDRIRFRRSRGGWIMERLAP
jgi:pyridoxamine-phosphate oxidase